MNTTNAAVGTGVIVVLGRWSEGDGMSVRIVVGVLFLAVFLSVIPERLSKPVAVLILVTVLFRYAPGIITKSGIASAGTGNGGGGKIDPGTVVSV